MIFRNAIAIFFLAINVFYGTAYSCIPGERPERRSHVSHIKILALDPQIKQNLRLQTDMGMLGRLYTDVTQKESDAAREYDARRAEHASLPAPYDKAHGLGTIFEYTDGNEVLRPLLAYLADYSAQHLMEKATEKPASKPEPKEQGKSARQIKKGEAQAQSRGGPATHDAAEAPQSISGAAAGTEEILPEEPDQTRFSADSATAARSPLPISRNLLVVRYEFLNAANTSILPALDVGAFVSGSDSYEYKPHKRLKADMTLNPGQKITIVEDEKPEQSPFSIWKPPYTAEQIAHVQAYKKITREKYCLDDTGTASTQVLTLPVLQWPFQGEPSSSFGDRPLRMQLLPISLVLKETDKAKIVRERFTKLCKSLFLLQERTGLPKWTTDALKTGPDTLPIYRDLMDHKAPADMICKILYGQPALDDTWVHPPQKGSFEHYFESAFIQSEQAWIAALSEVGQPRLIKASERWLSEMKAQRELDVFKALGEVKKIRIHLISQKDICQFCRGSLSFLLSSTSEKPSWMSEHTRRFVKCLAQACSTDSDQPQEMGPLEVEIYASGLELAGV